MLWFGFKRKKSLYSVAKIGFMKKTFSFLVLFLVLLTACKQKPENKATVEETKTTADRVAKPEVGWKADFIGKKNMSANDKAFIEKMAPAIRFEADQIKQKRDEIISLQNKLNAGTELSQKDLAFLKQTAGYYDMPYAQFHPKTTPAVLKNQFEQLLLRVDIVPPKLAMAQAIIESDWGKSRFAKEGNAFFGVHCYNKGCGMAARGVKDPKFWVKSYPNVQSGVKDYMHFLNTMESMKDFRKIRAKERHAGRMDPGSMADGLLEYSGIGEKYAQQIKEVISDYVPDNL